MKRLTGMICAGVLLLGGCDGRITDDGRPPVPTLDAELRQLIGAWGAMPIAEMPVQDAAQVALGRALFFDPVLSGNRDVACASCHSPAHGLTAGVSLPAGTGGELLSRRAPSLLNSGIGTFYLLWDGRISGFGAGMVRSEGGIPLPLTLPNALAAQAMLPVLDRREMRGRPGDLDVTGQPNELALLADERPEQVWAAVAQRLLAIPEYRAMFSAAFPHVAAGQHDFVHAATALAAFQRAAFMRTGSPFDRYLARDDAALSVPEKRGAILFFGRALCSSCHSGPQLGGNSFANIGAPQIGAGGRKDPPRDLGRGEIQDFEFYRFAFRVPPLRNVELTAPYLHNGAYATLEAVVRHYDDAQRALRNYDATQLAPALRPLHRGDAATVDAVLATLDPRLRQPLNLSDRDVADLVAFLKSLTDPTARDLHALRPPRVPSGLSVPD